jgi:tetratricopeptide (TPR) repeat protein
MFKEKIKIIKISAVALLIIGNLFILNIINNENNEYSKNEFLVEARSFFDKQDSAKYNILNADTYYHKVLDIDEKNQEALYQISRIHYIIGSYKEAFTTIEKYKEFYPEDKRIYYVSGLANAYAKKLNKAEEEFKTFVDSGTSNEAGFLDLAWVQFQKGDFESAKSNLEKGIFLTGGEGNAWLNSSLAMNLFNLGQKEEALALLYKSRKQLGEITQEVWNYNYSMNDPKKYKQDMESFARVIDFNIAKVMGSELEAESFGGFNIQALSPKRESGGYAVSACCASNYNQTCSNNCGETGPRGCSGNCPVSNRGATVGNGVRVGNNTTPYIVVHGSCKRVINNSGKDIFIPIKYQAEWDSFLSHTISGVTK